MRATVVGLIAGLFLLPAALEAQACGGSHAPRGSFAFGAGASFNEDVTSYGGSVGGNFQGPVFASASYSRSDIDGLSEDGNTVGGRVGFETVTDADLSLCLFGGLDYTWFDIEGADLDGVTIQAGPAIGYSAPIGEEGIYLTPHASAGVVHTDFSASGFGVTVEESSTDGFVRGGVAFGSRTIWLGGTVTQVTADGADPTFGVSLGVAVQ